MAVEQFDPSTRNYVASQITTLDMPSKMIEEQYQEVVTSHLEANRAAKMGFVSFD